MAMSDSNRRNLAAELPNTFSLDEVLAVAQQHPFYNSTVQYPLSNAEIDLILNKTDESINLESFAIIEKKDIYDKIQRLVDDTSDANSYRQAVYVSITGGGFGAKPLFFATDVYENRRHRARFGSFIRDMGIIEHGDWVLSTHCTGELYRSLDLTIEILENAGASLLSAGNHMSLSSVVDLLIKYHVNVLSSDSSQVAALVHYISTLSNEKRAGLKLNKIIYTSEILTAAQRMQIRNVLGPNLRICSLMASAESGPWAVDNPEITGSDSSPGQVARFLYDTRTMLLEVLPADKEDNRVQNKPLSDGEKGLIVQTSLSRLRNPLVRYNTGDIGSLHSLSPEAKSKVPESYWPHLKILEFYGRDSRFSFDWDGEYMDFAHLTALLGEADMQVLQWQAILDKLEDTLESTLEFRLLCTVNQLDDAKQHLVEKLKTFFHVYPVNEHRFHIVFLDSLDGFERSKTGRKIVKFIDRYTI